MIPFAPLHCRAVARALISALLAGTLGAATGAYAQSPFLYRAQITNIFSDTGAGGESQPFHFGSSPGQVTFGDSFATSIAGSLSVNTIDFLVGNPYRRSDTQSDANFYWSSPALDVAEAGVLARLDFSFSGTMSATATTFSQGVASVSYSILGTRPNEPQASGLFAVCPGTFGDCPSTPISSLTGSLDIGAGNGLQINLQAWGRTTGPAGTSAASAAASATLSYTLTSLEDRRHWFLPAGGPLAAATSWFETVAPDAISWAVFNSESPRQIALTLDTAREWRGIIVDGEQVVFDLAGQNLTLGRQGESLKSFNILLGEGRRETAASLVLRNGGVIASRDVVIGGVSVTGGAAATLTLEAGAVLNQTIGNENASVIVGRDGPGRLVVKEGSQLLTNALVLGPRAGSATGDLELTGAGSRISTQLLSVGERADANVRIGEGAMLQAQTLNLARFESATASLVVEGVGSTLSLGGGLSGIGNQGGRGTLEVRDKGLLQGDSTLLVVGSGKPSDFSVLRVSGAGTRMADMGVRVTAGGLLQVREGATWLDGVNGLEVKGGQALIDNARLRVGLLSAEGLFSNGSLVSSGRLDITNGSVVELQRGEMIVGTGGRVTISGSGTQVLGFDNLLLRGELAVNAGALLSGGVIGLEAGGILQGNGGTIKGTLLTPDGKVSPGNSPGELTIDGDVTLGANSELLLELAGTRAGLDYDVLHVTGNLRLDGGRITLSFLNGFAPKAGQKFTLLDVRGSFNSTAGMSVQGLEAGWDFDAGFDSGTGSFTLTSMSDAVAAVPEPQVWMMWCLGFLLLAGVKRNARSSQ